MAEDDDTLVAEAPDAAFLHELDAGLESLAPDARYRAVSTLGAGGMGEVRLARDLHVGRAVALKRMLPEHAKRPDLRARFIREARVQGQLEHPAIVPVYDLQEDADRSVFFTMKRVQGETLELVLERLRSGNEDAARAYTRHRLLTAFVRVCLAVDYAHSRGVVHRDLKPSNVMFGDFGEVHVLDWGLAKIDEAPRTLRGAAGSAAHASGPKLTNESDLMGTPAYMAPEQIEHGPIDARTDVYALGGILFEVLTLDTLPGDASTAAVLATVLKGVDARASRRAPDRDIPPELERICVKAAARQPHARYPTARAMAGEIEAFLSGDRDYELRRDIAKSHVAKARDGLVSLRGQENLAVRRAALRDAGRGVALTPDDPEALAIVIELMTRLPTELPAPVVAEVEESAAASQHAMLPRASVATAIVGFALLPALLASGAKALALLAPAAFLVCSAVALLAYRLDEAYRKRPPYLAFFMGLAVAASSLLYGPLLLAPALGVGMTAAYSASIARRYRGLLIALMLAGFIVPALLAIVGAHPLHDDVVDGSLVIAGVATQSRSGTYLLVTAMHVAALAFCVRFVVRYRDALTASESHNKLVAWQLRQLVPSESGEAMPPQ